LSPSLFVIEAPKHVPAEHPARFFGCSVSNDDSGAPMPVQPPDAGAAGLGFGFGFGLAVATRVVVAAAVVGAPGADEELLLPQPATTAATNRQAPVFVGPIFISFDLPR
jgi:hypothetical protein